MLLLKKSHLTNLTFNEISFVFDSLHFPPKSTSPSLYPQGCAFVKGIEPQVLDSLKRGAQRPNDKNGNPSRINTGCEKIFYPPKKKNTYYKKKTSVFFGDQVIIIGVLLGSFVLFLRFPNVDFHRFWYLNVTILISMS